MQHSCCLLADTGTCWSRGIVAMNFTLPANTTLQRVGGIATMPSRKDTFSAVLANVLPQLDRLYVFFDKYDAVPAFADHPKIVALHPSQAGNLGCDGKFLGIECQPEPCLYFCLDDDIDYPQDYVEVLTRALYRHHLRAVVGFHAIFFAPPYRSYLRDRRVLHFARGSAWDISADAIGTGTMAFCTGTFRFHPGHWPYHDMADLLVAIEAVKRQVPRVSVRRPENFLRPLQLNQEDSLYRRLQEDDSRHSAIMREALEAFPRAWQRTKFDTVTAQQPEIARG
jgi:hypothetical protein